MDFSHRQFNDLKMCLNHSQSGIEESLAELDGDFRTWAEHPQQHIARKKVLEHLVSFRWVLDQHFTRVAGEGYLENAVAMRPGMYRELREIECRQDEVLDDLDALVRRVRNCDAQQDSVAELFCDFQRLHSAILDEESLERSLVEKGLA
ncbi:MAG: hypothetical protein ACK6DC_21010 [Planctomycetota bacterium]|jgi:hypothetical protein